MQQRGKRRQTRPRKGWENREGGIGRNRDKTLEEMGKLAKRTGGVEEMDNGMKGNPSFDLGTKNRRRKRCRKCFFVNFIDFNKEAILPQIRAFVTFSF
ncbi:hypothetical protein Trydic_g10916 [Trypoxylus dichotomus]